MSVRFSYPDPLRAAEFLRADANEDENHNPRAARRWRKLIDEWCAKNRREEQRNETNSEKETDHDPRTSPHAA